jgi:AcrR family transcriptional regulator
MATSPQGRQRQTSAESREAILASANELLRTRPYRELSVETVMENADLSRTIFYRHFDGLSALVVALLTTLGQGMFELSGEFARNGLAARNGKASPDAELIRASLLPVIEFFVEHGPLVKGVVDASVEDADLESAYEGFILHFSAEAGDAIQGLKDAGAVDVLDAHATAEALTSLNENYLLRTLGRHPQEDPAVVLDTVATIWSRTLGLA